MRIQTNAFIERSDKSVATADEKPKPPMEMPPLEPQPKERLAEIKFMNGIIICMARLYKHRQIYGQQLLG